MKSKTIAIYSGEIPSTIFIERLLMGLSESGFSIYLFGIQKSKTKYPKNIRLVTYSNKFSKILFLLKYTILLSIYKPNEKKKLDEIIAHQSGSKKIKKIKYYPILYHKPDIFHLQWAKGIEDWLWVKQFGMKYVLSLRGTHVSVSPIANTYLKKSYEVNFCKIDGFHAVSKVIEKDARVYEQNLKNSKVIYSGLNLEKLIFKTKAKINSEVKILSIGRSHWVKGYSYALDAFDILKKENFKFHYTIIGVDDDEELIFQRNQLNLETTVNFSKNTTFDQIKEKIYEADIVLLPSVEEGIANVVLEAMALGTIVISTDCGGMTEVVKNEINGFIIPIRNSEAIAQAIKKVSNLTLTSYNEITCKARTSIEKQHSIDKMVTNFELFYNIVGNEKFIS